MTDKNKREPLPRPKNELTASTAGIGVSMSTGIGRTSPGRLYMLFKNMGKAAVIRHSTGRKLTSGDEPHYAKTARQIKTKFECSVEDIFFVRDPMNFSESTDWGVTYVIVKNLETGYYDVIEMPRFHTQNTELGFEYRYNKEELNKIQKGAILKKGIVFATSTRISASGEWCPGIETRVAAISHSGTEEDSVIMYESYARKCGVTFRREVEYQWDEDEWTPILPYGTDEEPRPCPANGERVRDDGVVMGFRRKNSRNALMLTKKALRTPDPSDKLFHVDPSCVVMNITVESERFKNKQNNRKAMKLSRKATQFYELFEKANNRFCNDVVNWYRRKTKEYSGNVPISEALWNLILFSKGGITIDNNQRINPIKRKYRHIAQKDWRVIIELKQSLDAKVRHKNTGMDGNKSTVGDILPDWMAPRDSTGVPVDMTVGNHPSFRRQTFNSLVELDINFINMRIYPGIKKNIDAGNFEQAWNDVIKFYETVSPDYAKAVKMLDGEGRIRHLAWIAADENEFSVWLNNNSDLMGIEIIKRLKETYPEIQPEHLTYYNEFGDEVVTTKKCTISTLHYVMLDKFGDDLSCQSTSRLNIYGLPTSLSKFERNLNFFKAVANRNLGEAEARLKVNQSSGAYASRMVSLANSPTLTDTAVKRIIRAKNPFLIKRLVKPGEEVENYQLQLISNIFGDRGLRIRSENEADRT